MVSYRTEIDEATSAKETTMKDTKDETEQRFHICGAYRLRSEYAPFIHFYMDEISIA